MVKLAKGLDARIALLVTALEQAFDHSSWHGPNLRNALRGVSAEQAAWRPAEDRHSIWDLAVHAAYWKYRVLRKLDAASPRGFDEPGSDFFPRPRADEAPDVTWQRDLERLEAWHRQLLAAVRAFDPERLDQVSYDDNRHVDLILGAAAHDVYHAGQIRLLRKLWPGGDG